MFIASNCFHISYKLFFLWKKTETKRREKEEAPTEVSFSRGVRAFTSDLAFGLSRGSYCKQREANRNNSVPSSFEK
jgi:hypothetical protein